LRSPDTALGWLLEKEWRELMAARAWWLMLALIGPLVGVCFIDAVRSFAEVSAGAGPGCGAVCAPLIGIWGPTFSAYEIAAVFLLPFVAIRLISGDKLSGASKLEIQGPVSSLMRAGTKAAVLLAGWLITLTGALIAGVLWTAYGGSFSALEMAAVVAGHVLNGGLTIGLAIALGSIAEHPSTAAIATLGITIGTWIVDFAAAVHGGTWERLAGFTPAAAVATFQHGLVRLDLILALLTFIAAGVCLAAVWMRHGVPVSRRFVDSLAVIAVAAALVASSRFARASWDVSESRQNSFSEAAEEALAHLPAPLAIDVHLAPQDVRRLQFERGPLGKLRRAVPALRVTYTARTASGLYEQSDEGYGEIRYSLAGRTESSRIVTDEGALETIFKLAGIKRADEDEMPYRGRPLVARPTGAIFVFHVLWPVSVALIGFGVVRRRT
jgi:ABC-2 type transport system permease protein